MMNIYPVECHSPMVDIENLKFIVDLPHTMGNFHAIEGYFHEIGYEVAGAEYQRNFDTDKQVSLVGWVVNLVHKAEDVIIMDVLAGKFKGVTEKILEVKKKQYG